MASMKQPGYRLPPKHLFGKLIKDFTTTMRFLCKSSFTSGPQTCKEWQPYHPFNHACAALEEGLPGSPGQSLRRLPHRFKELQQVLKTKLRDSMAAVIRNASRILMDAFVDSTFTFSHQSLRPTESNFAPVEEIGERTEVFEIEGAIPEDFPEGVYIRNARGEKTNPPSATSSAPMSSRSGANELRRAGSGVGDLRCTDAERI
uniref:Uncharacterized protein n=1 Tax=Leersia perrieri TaxID=77586 RepID=A0A0D9X791_9ORYZ